MNVSINDIERIGRNLYKHEGIYYRLFGKGVTPNNCWVIAPVFIELTDIDVSTGTDIFGPSRIEFDVTGTVNAHCEFITY
jgi:hypothetical protein